jgi:2-keto-4-pentenoate hydratase
VIGSADEAYQVQEAVYAQLWPHTAPRAWKAGSASDRAEPTGAPIAQLLASPARSPSAGMSMLGIEAEIAFRVDHDGSPVEALAAIEVCDTRLASWASAPPLWKLADFQSNEALVVGSGTRAWREIDFAAQEVELTIGARTIAARGSHPWGNPLRLLPWAAAHAARGGRPLRAGDLVTTGSWTGMEYARPGDEVVARFPGIGEAALRFDR